MSAPRTYDPTDDFEFLAAEEPAAAPAFLWEPYLAFGAVAVLDGDPGVGKSFLSLDLAARLTAGLLMPDGQPCPIRPGGHEVMIVNAEDNVDTTLIPRFLAAGGVLDRLTFFGGLRRGKAGRPASFPADFERWADSMRALPRSLVILDPLTALFPKKVSANCDQAIRECLVAFAEVAAETGACILFIRHLNKIFGRRALYRGTGSIGIAATARSTLLAGRHPDDPDRRVLTHVKNNLGPEGPSLGYRLTAGPTGKVVAWDGATNLTADDVVREDAATAGASKLAEKWLKETLAKGPVRATVIETEAAKMGIGFKTLRNAKKRIGADSRLVHTETERYWEWVPPEEFSCRLPPLDDFLYR